MSGHASTLQQRTKLAEAQGGICPPCGLPLPEDLSGAEVDHIIPRSRGGRGQAWNKRVVHRACNRGKSAKLTDEAIELAAKYGVALREPGRQGRMPGYLLDGTPATFQWRRGRA